MADFIPRFFVPLHNVLIKSNIKIKIKSNRYKVIKMINIMERTLQKFLILQNNTTFSVLIYLKLLQI
jgi:hypothetical protein